MGLDSRAVIQSCQPQSSLSLHILSHSGPSRNSSTPCRGCQRHSTSLARRRRLVLFHGAATLPAHPPRQPRLGVAGRKHLLDAADSALPALPSCRECARPWAPPTNKRHGGSLPFCPCWSIWRLSAGATADAASPALGVLHAGARRPRLLLCPGPTASVPVAILTCAAFLE